VYFTVTAGRRWSVVSVNPLFCLLRIKKKNQTRKGFSSFQVHIQSGKYNSHRFCFLLNSNFALSLIFWYWTRQSSFLNKLSVQNYVIRVGLEVPCVCVPNFTTFSLIIKCWFVIGLRVAYTHRNQLCSPLEVVIVVEKLRVAWSNLSPPPSH
jgi:hypothetical protein